MSPTTAPSKMPSVQRLVESRPHGLTWSRPARQQPNQPALDLFDHELDYAEIAAPSHEGVRATTVKARWTARPRPGLPNAEEWSATLALAIIQALLGQRPVAHPILSKGDFSVSRLRGHRRDQRVSLGLRHKPESTTPLKFEEPSKVPGAGGSRPLSHLELDHPQPPDGWALFLGRHGIAFVPDDLGRDCIRRGDAKRLLDEKRAHHLKVATRARVAEAEAVEADARWRASLPHGVSALDLPPGVSAGEAMLAAARQSAPRRQSLDVLGGGDSMVFHSYEAEREAG
jgi:hypothetical protein